MNSPNVSLEVPQARVSTRRPSEVLFEDVLPERFKVVEMDPSDCNDVNEDLKEEENPPNHCLGRITCFLCCFWLIPFLILFGCGDFVKEFFHTKTRTNGGASDKLNEEQK